MGAETPARRQRRLPTIRMLSSALRKEQTELPWVYTVGQGDGIRDSRCRSVLMATGSIVSIHEYLSTTYRPDCDYVDGVVVERSLGEYDHSRLQMAVSGYYYLRRKEWGVNPLPEQRVQVSPTRFRIPDICVTTDFNPPQIFATPPFICVEILSKDDTLSECRKRAGDYLHFGVPYVWILDPASRKAWRCTPEGMDEVTELKTENPDTLVPLAALFE